MTEKGMMLSRKLRLALLLMFLVCTVGCDQTSKHVARARLSQMGSVMLPGGLVELRLAQNPGSFLSFGALLPPPVRLAVFTWGVGVGLAALLVYLTRRACLEAVPLIGLSLIIAGGTSNLLDRILRHGLVTDFITIHIGPIHTGVFNAADVLIMSGLGLIIWRLRSRTSLHGPTNQVADASL